MELRKRAERILEERGGEGLNDNILQLIQEIDSCQLEFELQNEELRQAQIELEKSRNQYNELYVHAPVGLVTLTPNGLISRANRAAEEMLAGLGEVQPGKGFSRWIHAKDHGRYFACMRKVIEVGGRHACEVRLIGNGESFLNARIEASAHFEEAKRITEWLLTLSDIPERKQAEQALQRREQDLRDVLNNIVAIAGVMTPQGTLVEVNPIALQAANLKSEDVLGKPLEECYWWAWSPEVQQRLCEAIELAAAGKGSRYDEVVRVGGGKFRTIDFKVAPIFDPDGCVSFLIPSATDITERNRSKEELRKVNAELESKVLEKISDLEKQKELLQKIVNHIPVMIIFYTAEEVLYLNRKALEIIGVAGSEIRHGDIMQRCYPGPQYRKKLTEFMMAAPPEWKEFRMLVKGGKEIETSWLNIRLTDGSYVGIGIDITERKISERKMQRSLNRLERDNRLMASSRRR